MRVPVYPRSARSGINMTPMIDVVFLLIIFFLVSSHLAHQESTLPVSLPIAASADDDPNSSQPRITLTVTDDGLMHMGGQLVGLEQLPQRLAKAIESYGGDVEVRVRASRDLPYQQVEPVMVRCAVRHLELDVCRVRPGATEVKYRLRDRDAAADIGSTMTPMIDVVFLLLVFFVWTYSFQAVEMIIPSQLSAQSGNQSVQQPIQPLPDQDFERVVIRVLWDGAAASWQINTAPIASPAALRSNLKAIHDIHAETKIIIHPDELVPLGYVIEAFDIVRLVGFSKVSLAADMTR